MDNFEMITNEQLATVSGGGLKGKAVSAGAKWAGGKMQQAYKWWKGTDKPGTPSELYKEGREVAKDAGAVGLGYGAYKWSQGADKADPAAK
jgi:hypothetical protein